MCNMGLCCGVWRADIHVVYSCCGQHEQSASPNMLLPWTAWSRHLTTPLQLHEREHSIVRMHLLRAQIAHAPRITDIANLNSKISHDNYEWGKELMQSARLCTLLDVSSHLEMP